MMMNLLPMINQYFFFGGGQTGGLNQGNAISLVESELLRHQGNYIEIIGLFFRSLATS